CAMGLQVKDGVCTTSLLWLGDGEGEGDDHQMLGSGSAPPPTPSTTHPNPSTSSAATDLLSRLLHRLPPTLSTTPFRRKSSLTISPPSIPYTNLNSTTLHSISELGYFQLTDHPIPPQLAHSAQTDSLSIFKEKKHFTKNWPIGFNKSNEDEEDHDDDSTESLFLDSESLSDSSDELSLSSLHGFMHAMEKVGLSVVEGLTCAMGLQVKDGVCTTSLLWLGDGEGEGAVGEVL
nr:gibberellin 2-beta-dioxygenase 1 [Tanacetum cinerariifolium]